MPPTHLKSKILTVMRSRAHNRFTLKELQKRIGKFDKKHLLPPLKELIGEGKVTRIKKHHYALAKSAGMIAGRVHANPAGFGFLIPDDTGLEDIYLSRREMRRVMHGDRVQVRVEKKRHGRKQGHIVEILERAHKRIVGILERNDVSGEAVLVPMDLRISRGIKLASGMRAIESGQVVAAEITRYGGGYTPPEARVVETLGDPDDPEVQAKAVIFRFGWPTEFSAEAIAQADAARPPSNSDSFAGRTDLRSTITFTIDGENARDFDDAVGIERIDDERYRLYVCIADVAHYVSAGSVLDQEAYARSTSVYFPDRALPMLPPSLSTDVCSLKPHQDRLTKTALLEINERGEVEHAEFFDSIIQSDVRLTYTEVARILVDRDEACIERHEPAVVESLRLMEELTRRLMKKRIDRGSLDFELPEAEIVLDDAGTPIDIRRAERNIAHRMIEEFMIAANEAVARQLRANDISTLYRVHEGPDEETLEALSPFLSTLGYRLPQHEEQLRPKDMQAILEACRGKPEERVLNQLLLRSMKQAYYSPENIGHFGLASGCYLHFTSPIRRYPDLIVHRMLARCIKGERIKPSEKDELSATMDQAGHHTSQQERLAMDAEREMVDLKKAQFMTDKIGQEFPGVVTSLAPFGFFVELTAYFVEGLVSLESLEDDYYHYHEMAHVIQGQHHGRSFHMGDTVTIRVRRVKLFQGEIDFELIEERV